MLNTNFVEEILKLKLHNRISGFDVEADDVYQHIDECICEPTIEGFINWLNN